MLVCYNHGLTKSFRAYVDDLGPFWTFGELLVALSHIAWDVE